MMGNCKVCCEKRFDMDIHGNICRRCRNPQKAKIFSASNHMDPGPSIQELARTNPRTVVSSGRMIISSVCSCVLCLLIWLRHMSWCKHGWWKEVNRNTLAIAAVFVENICTQNCRKTQFTSWKRQCSWSITKHSRTGRWKHHLTILARTTWKKRMTQE